jgi:hypothetical protein
MTYWFNCKPKSGLKTLRAKLLVLLRLGKSGRFHRATLVGKYEPRFLTAKLKALHVNKLSSKAFAGT